MSVLKDRKKSIKNGGDLMKKPKERRLYYITSSAVIDGRKITMHLNEPSFLKNEYGYIYFNGAFVMNDKNVIFSIDSGLKNLRIFGNSKESKFLSEHKKALIDNFCKCFLILYENREKDFYYLGGKLKDKRKKQYC